MYSSIHFLFLLSLAVFSWAILCYFEEIEKRRICSPMDIAPNDPSNVPNEEAGQKILQENDYFQCHNNYDIYLNFVCIFACIYIIAKVVHIAERYLARQMYGKFNVYNDNIFARPTLQRPATSAIVENAVEVLRQKIEELTKQNRQLQFELSNCELENSDQSIESCLSSGDDLVQEVFITNNNYLQVNNKVYMNGVVANNFREKPKVFSSVWLKYMEMQRNRGLNILSNMKNERTHSPKIMSTEDLQKIYGLA